jgi:hypothetical protein
MAFVSSELPGFGNAFKDLADGLPQTELGKRLKSLFPQFAELAEASATGKISQTELIARLKELGPGLERFRDQMGAAGITALSDRDSGFGALFGSMYQFQEFMAKAYDPAKAAEEARKRELVTTALTNMSNVINDIRTKILLKFFEEGGIGARMQKWLETIGPKDIEQFNKNLNLWVDKLTKDPAGAIAELWDNMTNSLLGEMDEAGKRKGGLLTKLIDNLKPGFQKAADVLADIIGRAAEAAFRRITGEGTAKPLAGKTAITNEDAVTILKDFTGEGILNADDIGGVFKGLTSVEEFGGQDLANRIFKASGLDWTSMTSPWSDDRNVGDLSRALEEFYRQSQTEQGLSTDQLKLLQELNKAMNPPERRYGTYGVTGKLVEPKNITARLHAGERVLSPEEAAEYNKPKENLTTPQQPVTINQEGVIKAVNQLNMTMQTAAQILADIKAESKRQTNATKNMGLVY